MAEEHEPPELNILRRLSGCPGYPRYPKGEERYVDFLIAALQSDEHGIRAMDEFEGSFPKFEEFKAAVYKWAEICTRCSRARWEHGHGDNCRGLYGFAGIPKPPNDVELAVSGAVAVKKAVPEAPGLDPIVRLQLECIYIALGKRGTPPDLEDTAALRAKFPEAVAAIEKDEAPDYQLLAEQVLTKAPRFKRAAPTHDRMAQAQSIARAKDVLAHMLNVDEADLAEDVIKESERRVDSEGEEE